MTAWLIPAILLPLATGFLICSALWPSRPQWPHLLLLVSLGGGMGAGLCSFVLWLGLLWQRRSRTELLLGDGLLLAAALAAYLYLARQRHGQEVCPALLGRSRRAGIFAAVLALPVAVVLRIGIRHAAHYAVNFPEGHWDSWAIWSMGARFFYRAGQHWRDPFSGAYVWSHPDYPLLVQASIVRIWTYLGREAALVPNLLGLSFLLGILGVVMGALLLLRGATQSLLAGAVIATTPFLMTHAVAGYAECPVAFYFVSAIALALLSEGRPRLVALAGVFAAFAAWTKNEGQLYMASLGVAIAAAGLLWGNGRRCRILAGCFVLGAAPILAGIAVFKSGVRVNDWVFAQQSMAAIWTRLTTAGRYALAVRYYAHEVWRFGRWSISMPLALVVYGFLQGWTRHMVRHPWFLACIGTLSLALVGQFFVFIIAPTDLSWELLSLGRLLLQLWPAGVLLFFAAVRAPEELWT